MIKGAVAAALAEFEEELLPIVGYEPPPTPRPELDEEGNLDRALRRVRKGRRRQETTLRRLPQARSNRGRVSHH